VRGSFVVVSDRGFALTIALTAGMDWAMSLHEALVEGDDGDWV